MSIYLTILYKKNLYCNVDFLMVYNKFLMNINKERIIVWNR